ncbi:MAG: NAD-dependent epimerase/dehydratase family protein [Dehalococcoidia bacterium]
MKTVVTGGAGFIGSHLVKRLVEQGREVVVADDFSRGKAQNLLDLGIRLDPHPIDLRDYQQALESLDGAESVFHLAARVGSVEFLHGSDMAELLALQANLTIDANVLKACLETGVKTLVYASSVSVYPIDTQQRYDVLFTEDDVRYINPEGGYGWAKLLGEIQVQWMRGLNRGIARIFNIYGENEEPDENAHVVPALMRKGILYPQEEFLVWGDGNQTRDLLYVADAVEALLTLEGKTSSPPVVVNIGSGEALPVRALANKIVEISGKAIEPSYDPTKPVGPLSRTAAISRAKALLGWEPEVSLDEGLSRTYRWVAARMGVRRC